MENFFTVLRSFVSFVSRTHFLLEKFSNVIYGFKHSWNLMCSSLVFNQFKTNTFIELIWKKRRKKHLKSTQNHTKQVYGIISPCTKCQVSNNNESFSFCSMCVCGALFPLVLIIRFRSTLFVLNQFCAGSVYTVQGVSVSTITYLFRRR